MSENKEYLYQKELIKRLRDLGAGKDVGSPSMSEDSPKQKIQPEPSMKQMIGSMRNLRGIEKRKINEDVTPNELTSQELEGQKENFRNAIQNLNANVEFEEFLVMNGGVFWGGTIDNKIQWTYSVTPSEKHSGVKVNYLEDFNRDIQNPENKELIKRIENYFNDFYKYWRENELDIQNP